MRHGVALVTILFATLVLTGCAAPEPGPQQNMDAGQVHLIKSERGVKTDVAKHFNLGEDSRPVIAWTSPARKTVTLVTYGSSSCPVVPEQLLVSNPRSVILLTKTYDDACTADLGPHTSEFRLPASVSRDADVRVSLRAARQPSTPLMLSASSTLEQG